MLNGKTLRAMAALLALLSLGACDTAKGLINTALNGDQPQDPADDSVKRPPLTLPPDYNLRPPAATAATATDVTASQQGRATVFGLDEEQAKQNPAAGIKRQAGLTLGESALLQHAGAASAAKDIRTKVDQETEKLDREDKAFTETLIKGQPQQPQQPQEETKKADSGGVLGAIGKIFSPVDTKPTMQRQGDSGIF
ncbi:MAG TPA: DUF3035 domain-containing protein [Alphaproteobacteria bacterium]|nr:DUF3035 domain-containing protein [Alphaproteobacteria bacterium]